jgi:hypothetical protein
MMNQNRLSIAIGQDAASRGNQGAACVAIGRAAGNTGNNQNFTIAIGDLAGGNRQGASTIAIGAQAGLNSQGSFSVAIGSFAGNHIQGTNCIAIGQNAGLTGQHNNTIVLSAVAGATGTNTIQASSFYVNPVRSAVDAGATGVMIYNDTTKEITYSTAKTFVIDHPFNENKYLVHSCLEGPEAGVYYRGMDTIINEYAEITLPDYVRGFNEPTPHITAIYNGKPRLLNASEIVDNKFKVYGEPGPFSWLVFAKRLNIEVEPKKNSTLIRGTGPYKYIDTANFTY